MWCCTYCLKLFNQKERNHLHLDMLQDTAMGTGGTGACGGACPCFQMSLLTYCELILGLVAQGHVAELMSRQA